MSAMSIPEPLRAPPRPAEGAQPPHAPQNLLSRVQAILPNESHHLLTAQLVKTGNKSSRLTPSNNWFQTQNTEGLPSKRCCIYIAKESDFRDEMWVFTSKKWLYQQIDRLLQSQQSLNKQKRWYMVVCGVTFWYGFDSA